MASLVIKDIEHARYSGHARPAGPRRLDAHMGEVD
jgi:hypothetical protein